MIGIRYPHASDEENCLGLAEDISCRHGPSSARVLRNTSTSIISLILVRCTVPVALLIPILFDEPWNGKAHFVVDIEQKARVNEMKDQR